jgi:hypothetical protein
VELSHGDMDHLTCKVSEVIVLKWSIGVSFFDSPKMDWTHFFLPPSLYVNFLMTKVVLFTQRQRQLSTKSISARCDFLISSQVTLILIILDSYESIPIWNLRPKVLLLVIVLVEDYDMHTFFKLTTNLQRFGLSFFNPIIAL